MPWPPACQARINIHLLATALQPAASRALINFDRIARKRAPAAHFAPVPHTHTRTRTSAHTHAWLSNLHPVLQPALRTSSALISLRLAEFRPGWPPTPWARPTTARLARPKMENKMSAGQTRSPTAAKVAARTSRPQKSACANELRSNYCAIMNASRRRASARTARAPKRAGPGQKVAPSNWNPIRLRHEFALFALFALFARSSRSPARGACCPCGHWRAPVVARERVLSSEGARALA